jgi:hypothetical protein
MGSLKTPPTKGADFALDFPTEPLACATTVVVVVVEPGAFWIAATPWIGVMPPRSGEVAVIGGGVDWGLVVGGVVGWVVGTVVAGTVVVGTVVVVGGGQSLFLHTGLVVVVVGNVVVVVRSGRVMMERVIGEPIAG